MSTNCVKNISPPELNILLVPTFLQGMNNAQICAFIKSCNKKSNLFKNQVINFFHKMKLAKQYTVERKCYCPTKIEWTVSSSPLIISQKSMTKYIDFASFNNKEFSFILRKVIEFVKNNKICKQMIQDGKEGCCK